MGKKRNPRKRPDVKLSDQSDEEEEVVVVKRKPLRAKSSISSNPDSASCENKDNYDADSEPEKQDEVMTLISSLPNKIKPLSKTKTKPVAISKGSFAILQDFSVNLDDCMINEKKDLPCLKVDKTPLSSSDLSVQNCNFECQCGKCLVKDQENVTPPSINSTSASLKSVKNLGNESLFGFDDIERKLNYSPASKTTSNDISMKNNSRTSRSLTTYGRKSFSKRKFELGFDDVAMDAPKKQNKRKKNDKETAMKLQDREKEALESMLQQFQEVEMHELIVE